MVPAGLGDDVSSHLGVGRLCDEVVEGLLADVAAAQDEAAQLGVVRRVRGGDELLDVGGLIDRPRRMLVLERRLDDLLDEGVVLDAPGGGLRRAGRDEGKGDCRGCGDQRFHLGHPVFYVERTVSVRRSTG